MVSSTAAPSATDDAVLPGQEWILCQAHLAFEQVALIGPDGESEHALNPNLPGTHQTNPDWSPDGNQITFIVTENDGTADLWSSGIDGTAGPGSPASGAWATIAKACRASMGDHLGLVSTAQTARDVDVIRQALRVEVIDWFGTSYGTRVGVEYLRQFPDRVRSMVLDGAVDPSASFDQSAAEPGVQRFLESCAGQDPCPSPSDLTSVPATCPACIALQRAGNGTVIPRTDFRVH